MTKDRRSQFGKWMMELLGTGLLVLTIQLSFGLGVLQGPLAIGGVLISLVYTGDPISGAHYNPAVSLAIMLRGNMDRGEMLLYWVFQIVGGFLGALLGGIICGNFVEFSIGEGHTVLQAYLAEFVFTFLLCFVVLGVATHADASDNHYYGVAIGLVVMSGAITVGPISGAAFNPAVVLGLGLAKTDVVHMVYIVSTVVANLVGGASAAAVFYLVAPDQFVGTAREVRSKVGASETTILV
mmetsp:Transcript_69086/g.77280  ORF Transcript_69086/g.77280 Transcript_69086/m.77280 type:complete len:239 (+) Transcript_69086:73-789(+)